MMRALMLCISIALIGILTGCGKEEIVADYTSIEFEQALNEGVNVEGKAVEIYILKIAPASAFGHNLQAGEHLNFVSVNNPGYKAGDTVILEVDKVASVLGSFVITYK